MKCAKGRCVNDNLCDRECMGCEQNDATYAAPFTVWGEWIGEAPEAAYIVGGVLETARRLADHIMMGMDGLAADRAWVVTARGERVYTSTTKSEMAEYSVPAACSECPQRPPHASTCAVEPDSCPLVAKWDAVCHVR